MKKIMLLPLDERPCNYKFPSMMPLSGFELLMPPKDILGDKKLAGDYDKIKAWVLENAGNADGIILSLDMLLYGGIVPSRLHKLTKTEISERIDIVREIRKINSTAAIYAFQLIMRCPWYSSDDEEPDYYEHYGTEIHNYGKYFHLESLGLLSDEQKLLKEENNKKIPTEVLSDYLNRRELNLWALDKAISFIQDGTVDFFIVPQDDSAEYGFTALNQIGIRKFIEENGLSKKVCIYPGADEVGMTLLSRMVCHFTNNKPNIYVYYASSNGAAVIPSFEDRPIDETIKYQIYAAGGRRVNTLLEADILAAVNISAEMEGCTPYSKPPSFDMNRCLTEYVEVMEYALSQNKAVAVLDVAYPNCGDIGLLKLLENENLLPRINSYAGWNTSSNTIGTALCQCVLSIYAADEYQNRLFSASRVVEDAGYCGYVRKYIVDNYLPDMGLDYFNADGKNKRVARIVETELDKFIKNELPQFYKTIDSISAEMPWRRMFEVDVTVKIKQDKEN